MTLRNGLFVRKDATKGTTPDDARLALAGMFSAPGVLTGGTVSGTSSWAYSVGAFVVVSQRAASDGVVVFANDAAVQVATTAAPGTGARIDIIYALHRDVDNADADSQPVLAVAQGIASGSPVAPVIPTGAVELARATVGAGATNTAHANVTISTTSRPRARILGTARSMIAVKTATAYNLPDNQYNGIGTSPVWTAIGPAEWPPEFVYEASNKTVNGQGLRAVVAGLYRISASVQFEVNSAGYRAMRIIKNGSGTIVKKNSIPALSGVRTSIQLDATAYLEPGDTLGVQIIQSSGSSLALYLGEDSPSIVMEYLGS